MLSIFSLLLVLSCSKDVEPEAKPAVIESTTILKSGIEDCGDPDEIAKKIREAEGSNILENTETGCKLED